MCGVRVEQWDQEGVLLAAADLVLDRFAQEHFAISWTQWQCLYICVIPILGIQVIFLQQSGNVDFISQQSDAASAVNCMQSDLCN
jgi:hypothetical protein